MLQQEKINHFKAKKNFFFFLNHVRFNWILPNRIKGHSLQTTFIIWYNDKLDKKSMTTGFRGLIILKMLKVIAILM